MTNPVIKLFSNIKNFVLRYRWQLSFLISFVFLFIEIHEHGGFGSLQIDFYFLFETVIYSVVLPLTWIILLTIFMRADREKQNAIADLSQHDDLSRQLSGASQLEELTESIVKFPQTVVPVIGTSLYLFNNERSSFELVSEWAQDGKPRPYLPPLLKFDECALCFQPNPDPIHSTIMRNPCSQLGASSADFPRTDYCIPLIRNTAPVAVLHLVFPSETTLTDNQVRVLDSVAYEMALAIEGAQLKRSVMSQEEAALAERRRIAQNLHDTLGQNISYLRLKLDHLSERDVLWEISQVKTEIERMRTIAEDAYQQVRGTLTSLRSDSKLDLEQGLQEIARRAADRTGFNLKFQCSNLNAYLSHETVRQILFICREALNNIEKHAAAKQVLVLLEATDSEITITVKDDGVGFEPEIISSQEQHFGLEIMRERAAELGAELSIYSKPGHGTRVELKIPINTLLETGASNGSLGKTRS
jgi:signal transduction histidine kinase